MGHPLLVVDMDSALHHMADSALLAQLQPRLDDCAPSMANQDEGDDPVRFVIHTEISGDKRQQSVELYRLKSEDQFYYLAVLHPPILPSDTYAAAYYHNIATLFPNIAHEIRGDLNGIVINLELLKGEINQAGSGFDASQGLRRYAEIATQSVYTLNRSLQSLLGLVQALNEPIKVFDMVKLLDDIQVLTASQAKSQRTVVFYDMPEGPILIAGRAGQLRQALLTLMLHIMRKLASDSKLSVQAREQDDALVIEVRIYTRAGNPQDDKAGMDNEASIRASLISIEAHGGTVQFQGGLNPIHIRLPLAGAGRP